MKEVLKSVNSVNLPVTVEKLWEVLTQPEWTEKYMYNCRVISDLKPGSSMDWVGNFQEQNVHLIGEVLESEPPFMLKYSTIDPDYMDATVLENFIHITYLVRTQNKGVLLTVVNETFDGDEERMKHIVDGWEKLVFPTLKKIV